MRTLKFNVRGQTLEKDPKCDYGNIVAGSKEYLLFEFNFSEELNGYRKVACFIDGPDIEYVPIINERCIVPDNVTDSRKISFFLTFVANDQKFATNKLSIKQEVIVQ